MKIVVGSGSLAKKKYFEELFEKYVRTYIVFLNVKVSNVLILWTRLMSGSVVR